MALNDRKAYLDWLRGFAVVIMVEAHVVDAWTREADRDGTPYFWAVFVAGLAAPLFLFLAGLSMAMAASARGSKMSHAATAERARWRGWQIFALAFLFRIQSQLLGWGAFVNLLKVDILNVMGLAMVAAGALWGVSSSRTARVLWFALATTLLTMGTPLLREASWPAVLPDPVEWYLRPAPGRTTFTLFPWAGFLFAGAMVGDMVHAARLRVEEVRLQLGLLAAGIAGIVFGYAASFGPSIYPVANFWTSSPTFFCIRLGIAVTLVPLAWAVENRPGLFSTLGRSSLFVYWIHVEMVYGVLGRPMRRVR